MCSLTSAKAPSCVRLCRCRSPANLLSLHELIIISLSPSLRSNLPATVALLHSHSPILQQQSSPPPPQPDTRKDINQWLSVDERIEEQKAADKQFMSCCSTCCGLTLHRVCPDIPSPTNKRPSIPSPLLTNCISSAELLHIESELSERNTRYFHNPSDDASSVILFSGTFTALYLRFLILVVHIERGWRSDFCVLLSQPILFAFLITLSFSLLPFSSAVLCSPTTAQVCVSGASCFLDGDFEADYKLSDMDLKFDLNSAMSLVPFSSGVGDMLLKSCKFERTCILNSALVCDISETVALESSSFSTTLTPNRLSSSTRSNR
ncbi:hypothetical protein BLNAU_10944 [Blattamonas nauphoetae]|uniref:Uncharacterized protein n=1 Tax=Blattamonas nauphoetae TaxID=2049346 RepID=A0ABQ9XNY5_9EUKA|nr:hypothetical protein BLNAU_10944 [Blattamonas nauphoetae]